MINKYFMRNVRHAGAGFAASASSVECYYTLKLRDILRVLL